MGRRVVLVGHCGPDSSYLRLAIRQASPGAQVINADDPESLDRALIKGVDLVLLNRELDMGFAGLRGVDLLRQLRPVHPDLKFMLVSNFAEAQAEARSAGALEGFGKRELGTPRVVDLLRAALEDGQAR